MFLLALALQVRRRAAPHGRGGASRRLRRRAALRAAMGRLRRPMWFTREDVLSGKMNFEAQVPVLFVDLRSLIFSILAALAQI